MQFEKVVDVDKENGLCPFCKSEQYTRDLSGFINDNLFFNCHCEKCNNEFKEMFVLVYQNWDE